MKMGMDFFEDSIAGVELNINAEGSYLINLCILKKEKNSVSILNSGIGLQQLEETLKSIAPDIPLIISLNGKGVIYKKMSKAADESYESLLHKVLPNGKVEDFFIQLYEIDKQPCYISVCRKSLIQQIKEEFSVKGHKIIGLALGPFLMHGLLPAISQPETTSLLDFSSYQITINNNHIEQFITLPSPVPSKQIDKSGFKINSNLLISYSTALSYFNPVITLTNNSSLFNDELIEYKTSQKFKKTGVYITTFFFVLLLTNFIAFSYFTDQVRAKSSNYALVSHKVILLDSLQKQVEERNSFLSKSGLSEPSRASFYADQIAKDLPSTILLSSINIQPLKKKDDDHKKPEFENGKILVSGVAKFAMDVNDWSKLLKGYAWVKSVNLQNFKQKEGENQGEFTLELQLK